jgi:hypothetical protein
MTPPLPAAGNAGTFAASGSGSCTDCPRGKYTSTEGQFGCESCVPGRYTNTTRAVSCDVCRKGQYQSAVSSKKLHGISLVTRLNM